MNEMVRGKGQVEWAWKVGLYLALSSAGAGAYLAWQVARALDPAWDGAGRVGAALGILLAMVGALSIFLDLGRWQRFYLAASRVGTAWESRGFLLLSTFGLVGLLQVAGWVLAFPGWDGPLSVVETILAVALLPYGGLLLSSLRPFPLWTDPMQVAVFVTTAAVAGCGILSLDPWLVESQLRDVGMATAIVALLGTISLVLLLMRLRGGTPAMRASAEVLGSGIVSRLFWIGAVGLGLGIPILVGGAVGVGLVGAEAVRLAGGCALVGVVLLRYTLLVAARRPANLSFRGLGPWGLAR